MEMCIHSANVHLRLSTSRPRDVIKDYYDAGLDKATYVNPDRRTIERNRLVRKMGELSEFDREKFGM